MSIEALVYDLLEAHKDLVSYSTMMKWTPAKILAELQYADPDINVSRSLTLTKEDGEIVQFGEDRRFSVAWANKAHNALGSFLHEPVVRPKRGNDDIFFKAAAKANDILKKIEEVLDAPIANFRVGRWVKIKCSCGFQITRDASFLEAGKDVSCAQCGCEYDYAILAGQRVEFHIRGSSFKCPSCDEQHLMPKHELKHGLSIRCKNCGREIRFRSGIVLDD